MKKLFIRKRIALLLTFCLVAGFIPMFPTQTEAAGIKVEYRYNKKNYTYKGAVRYASVNGKNIGVKKKPIILVDDTNLAPYYDLLVKSGIKAKKDYKKKKKELSITYRSNTIKMKMGKRTAYVNGKKVSLPTAPRNVKYKKSGESRILVPIYTVCRYLGLKYKWVSSSKRMYITEPPLEKPEEKPEKEPEQEEIRSEEGEKLLPGYTIMMERPAEIEAGEITVKDDYNNKRLVIEMEGDWREYYSEHKPEISGNVKFKTSYDEAENETRLYFTTSSISGFLASEGEKNIYIKHGKPQSIYKNVIVLDAGHGGSDSGAVGNGYKEKDFTLSIVKAAKKYFDKNSDYKVYYTRLKDTYPSLQDRYELANEVDADIFVSVHINSATKTATGTETLYNPDRNKSQRGLDCYNLAKGVQKDVRSATGFPDRGLKKRCTRLNNGLAVLNHNDGPATLTEIGFISNKAEAKKMKDNLSRYGKAVYDSILRVSK